MSQEAKGKNVAIQMEACKDNVFVGGWEFVPSCDVLEISLEQCQGNTFGLRDDEEEGSSTPLPPLPQTFS